MSESDVERIQVNVRVDKSLKEAFDEEIVENFGTLRPYAGIELERECRAFLDRGDINDLRAVVDDLTAVFSGSDRKNKIRKINRRKSTTVGYRISDQLRHELKNVAQNDYRSIGRLVEAIMYRYVTEGNIIQRLTKELYQVLEHVENDHDDALGAKGRRTQTIIAELENIDQDAFDMTDFEQAIETASGIGVSAYTKKEYLPRVLDTMNYTWDPENPGRFIDKESYNVPNIRDLTTKPYLLMQREDKRKAIKIAAYKSVTSRSPTTTIEDATAVLQGRPKRSTIKALLREISSSAPGYQYSAEKGKLKVDTEDVVDNPGHNLDVIAVEHISEDWVDSAVDSLLQLRQDADHELRDFPDRALDKKIAAAKYPELLTGNNGRGRNPTDYITQNDRKKVLERLANDLGEPSVEIYSDRQEIPARKI